MNLNLTNQSLDHLIDAMTEYLQGIGFLLEDAATDLRTASGIKPQVKAAKIKVHEDYIARIDLTIELIKFKDGVKQRELGVENYYKFISQAKTNIAMMESLEEISKEQKTNGN